MVLDEDQADTLVSASSDLRQSLLTAIRNKHSLLTQMSTVYKRAGIKDVDDTISNLDQTIDGSKNKVYKHFDFMFDFDFDFDDNVQEQC
eukprot:CAMPEP_0116973874 /NCGR_PEP_ID=MMETSP0467-20121206/54790_1 /TAXON_ID=283647 /ORGANISM="Mesodinium pulex, Strain SPMC105" /LENGTH=88 /DNA_ID=CAMNT_0004665825 /DNA_START=174 /DNA_END=441 /DNA_ORIENTATION=+